jgi:putative sigma-54 modulation protein
VTGIQSRAGERGVDLSLWVSQSRPSSFARLRHFDWILFSSNPILDLMKFVLSTHNVTLTKAIEDHILARIDKLEHYDRWAVDARVTLEHDHTKAPERAFQCSIRLGVRGPDLYAEDRDRDLYAAIDKVSKKIEQQIRKRHSKAKARKHTEAALGKRRRQDAEI